MQPAGGSYLDTGLIEMVISQKEHQAVHWSTEARVTSQFDVEVECDTVSERKHGGSPNHPHIPNQIQCSCQFTMKMGAILASSVSKYAGGLVRPAGVNNTPAANKVLEQGRSLKCQPNLKKEGLQEVGLLTSVSDKVVL